MLAWEARERGVTVETHWPKVTPRVLANDADLRMLALNLIQNALHAMPKGGRLNIAVEQAPGWIGIHFEDTGVGISAHDREHIFEPFFSRRADGVRGTGLGLAICEAIATSHGGHIECVSQIGAGSRFSVFFPDPALPDNA